MPYLTESAFNAPCGELNRAFTKILLNPSSNIYEAFNEVIKHYIYDQKARYATFNDVIGALECTRMEYSRRSGSINNFMNLSINRVKQDFYRDIIAPYEDKKMEEHGDIYKR